MQRFTVIILVITLLLSGCDFVRSINPFSKKVDNNLEAYQRQQDSLQREAVLKEQQEAARLEQLRAESLRLVQEQEAMAVSLEAQYHLIVGAFKTPEYAESFHNMILAQGHPSKILMSENNFHLVTIKSTDNYRAAVNDWRALKDQGEHEEVWLYRKN